MPDRTDGRSSEEIRRSIEQTRSQMDETVETLEDRLAPKKLMNQAWDRIKGQREELGSRVGGTVREHPLPVLLVGLGLGWLAIEEIRGRSDARRTRREVHAGTQEPAEGRVGPYGPDAVNRDDPDWEYASRTQRVKAKARGLRHRAREVTRGARHAQARVSTFIDENPLAVGAIAFGLGLASAMSVPPSEAESRVAGHASDRFKRQARETGREIGREARAELQDVGREATERAARVAEDAARAARRDVGSDDLASRSPQHETASQRHPRTDTHGTVTQHGTTPPGIRRPEETRPSRQQPPRGP